MESRFGHGPPSGARWEVHGPTEGTQVVEAWADGHIPFEPKVAWQKDLRSEIRSSCRLLEPPPGQLLRATFHGPMPRDSDVENLLLYNIDNTFQSFKLAGRHGIRFEYGGEVPPPVSNGALYRFGFRYAFEPRDDELVTAWKQGRMLASFGWTDLGAFARDNKLAQVWLALARCDVEPFFPAVEPDAKFAVRVQVRPPRGKDWVLGKLVKPIVDGVICAFQAHTDTEDLTEIVERLAKGLPVYPEDLRRYLRDECRAVLRTVPRLFRLHGASVKGNPSDDLCLAGELLPADPINDRWAIKGRIVEIKR
jgi:hypothetical protein